MGGTVSGAVAGGGTTPTRCKYLQKRCAPSVPPLKRVGAGTGGEMPDERVEHPRMDSAGPNAAGRGPMPEVRRTPEEELARPSFVAGHTEPLGKPVEVLANRTLP